MMYWTLSGREGCYILWFQNPWPSSILHRLFINNRLTTPPPLLTITPSSTAMMASSASSSSKNPSVQHKAVFYTSPDDVKVTIDYIRTSVGKDWESPKWLSIAPFDLVSHSVRSILCSWINNPFRITRTCNQNTDAWQMRLLATPLQWLVRSKEDISSMLPSHHSLMPSLLSFKSCRMLIS